MQVVDVFQDTALSGSRDADVINERKMLDVFTETDTTGVGAYRDIELFGHEQDGKDFVDTGNAARVDLAEIDGVCLKELLKDDTVLDMLTGGNSSAGIERLADSGVTQDIVRRGRFLNKVGLELQEIFHPRNSLVHVPDLVSVHHQHTVVTDFLTDQGSATDIRLLVAANLLLKVGETLCLGFSAKSADLFIAVA